MSKPPDRETLRNLISAVLPTDSDIEALCIDRFPETARRFTDGMDRVRKVNLLLLDEGPEQILQAIQERDPARYDQHRQQLSLPPRSLESPMAAQAPSAPKQVPVTAKPTAANIKGGQEQDMTSASGPVHADVVIITALKEEYDEARKVHEGAIGDWSVNHDLFDREVAFRTYEASNGPLRIALTWASRMRVTTAADTAGRLLDRLSAQCVAMCGVCAGRRGKVQPGDVIVGDLLYTYDAGSVQVEYDPDGTKHERFQADPDPVPLNETWRHRAQAFKPPVNSAWILARPATLAAQGDWILARLHGGEDPMTHRESQERCPAWKEALKRLEDLGYVSVSEHAKMSLSSDGRAYISRVLLDHRGSLPESPPWHIHLAPIATGSSVMRDPKLFERLPNSMRKVLGVEMEAAAIAAVGHSRNLPWLVMKGVMDHADQDKDDLLKSFAARASAECLILFLRHNTPEQRPRLNVPEAVGAASTPASIVSRIGPSFAPQTAAPASKPKPTASYSTQNATEELAELKKKLESLLRRDPALVAALGKHGAGASDPVKAIAIALTGLDARSLVDDLYTLTKKDSALQTAVRELLVHVLPLAVDWQSMVANAEAEEHPHALELPLRTMTLAEVINARLDNRSCVFAPGGGDLQGVAHVRMPSVSHAPFFDRDGQVMAQAVTSNLWKEQQTSGTPLPGQDAWSEINKSVANKDEFCAAAQIEINKPNRKLNRYLLFIDATLAAAGLDDAALEASWRVTNQALKQTLPGLRLVRLKGRDAEWKHEYGLVSDIRDLHNP